MPRAYRLSTRVRSWTAASKTRRFLPTLQPSEGTCPRWPPAGGVAPGFADSAIPAGRTPAIDIQDLDVRCNQLVTLCGTTMAIVARATTGRHATPGRSVALTSPSSSGSGTVDSAAVRHRRFAVRHRWSCLRWLRSCLFPCHVLCRQGPQRSVGCTSLVGGSGSLFSGRGVVCLSGSRCG
jgi:hypothetical protein